jgi:hypothetical protein
LTEVGGGTNATYHTASGGSVGVPDPLLEELEYEHLVSGLYGAIVRKLTPAVGDPTATQPLERGVGISLGIGFENLPFEIRVPNTISIPNAFYSGSGGVHE